MSHNALVVEDDAQSMEAIEEVLTALRHRHDRACCLVEARRLLEANHYSYILTAVQFPTSSPTGPRRTQNCENLLDDVLAMGPGAPPVIILSDLVPEGQEGTESLVRMTMWLARKGACELVQKPIVTAKPPLDRVIRLVLLQTGGDGAPCGAPRQVRAGRGTFHHPLAGTNNPQVAAGKEEWLTVTRAAELLTEDLPDLDLARARSRVSTAASRGEFLSKGNRMDRRIEPHTFASWRLNKRNRDLAKEDKIRE